MSTFESFVTGLVMHRAGGSSEDNRDLCDWNTNHRLAML